MTPAKQGEMFEETYAGLRPLARTADPETSHAAAAALTAEAFGTVCLEVLRALSAWRAEHGAWPTQRELATLDPLGVNPATADSRRYGRRLSNLRELGMVHDGPPRTCSVTGRHALTWRLTVAGMERLGADGAA